jgi:dienelactone hydrolase
MTTTWDFSSVSNPPRMWPTEPVAKDHPAGLPAFFMESLPYQGKATRAYAIMGVPSVPAGKTVPGMVLLHGGGGSAFWEWVKLWNDRGYAAIAIDQCGATVGIDGLGSGTRPRHEHGGPPGWNDSFGQMNSPMMDQWGYHAAGLATLARKLLAAQPGVDGARIGVTGISWGGYLTSLVAGVDPGFACAIPVYGSGFLWEDSVWKYLSMLSNVPPLERHRWVAQWDPGSWLHNAKMPMLFVNGTNDFAYFMNSMQKSYRLVKGPMKLSVPVEMPHSHPDGWKPKEIGLFADEILLGADPLAKVTGQGDDRKNAWATYESVRPIKKAEFNFTRATGYWPDRKWNKLPAKLDAQSGRVEAAIPVETRAFYFNLFDDRDALVSSQHVEL